MGGGGYPKIVVIYIGLKAVVTQMLGFFLSGAMYAKGEGGVEGGEGRLLLPVLDDHDAEERGHQLVGN